MPGDKINFLANGRGNPSPIMLGFDGARATMVAPTIGSASPARLPPGGGLLDIKILFPLLYQIP